MGVVEQITSKCGVSSLVLVSFHYETMGIYRREYELKVEKMSFKLQMSLEKSVRLIEISLTLFLFFLAKLYEIIKELCCRTLPLIGGTTEYTICIFKN